MAHSIGVWELDPGFWRQRIPERLSGMKDLTSPVVQGKVDSVEPRLDRVLMDIERSKKLCWGGNPFRLLRAAEATTLPPESRWVLAGVPWQV